MIALAVSEEEHLKYDLVNQFATRKFDLQQTRNSGQVKGLNFARIKYQARNGDICDVKVFDMPGLNRLDYRTAKISESTLRNIDGIIVVFDSTSQVSQSRAAEWHAEYSKSNFEN